MDSRIIMLRQIFNSLDSENDISSFGKAIEFYLSTGYDKILMPEEIADELECHANNLPTIANFDNYFENVISNGYFTHSFNGYFLEHYRKNGIGATFYDQEMSENFEILEEFLGTSRYVGKYAKTIPEFYITSPGNNSIYYALMQSSERLWHGPLSQKDDVNPILPVVGETKSQYAMRIVEDKIEKQNISESYAIQVRKSAQNILDKLCNTNPIIAFIPTKLLMDCYVMQSGILYSSLGDIAEIDYVRKNGKTLEQYLQNPSMFSNAPSSYYNADKKQVDSTFFCKNFGGDWDKSRLDDISVLGSIIPFGDVQTIELEDSFAVTQRILKDNGVADGTPFNFNSIILSYYYPGLNKKITTDMYGKTQTSHHR